MIDLETLPGCWPQRPAPTPDAPLACDAPPVVAVAVREGAQATAAHDESAQVIPPHRPQVDLNVHTMYPAGDSPVHGPARILSGAAAESFFTLSRYGKCCLTTLPLHETKHVPPSGTSATTSTTADATPAPGNTPPPRHRRNPQPRRITKPATNKGGTPSWTT